MSLAGQMTFDRVKEGVRISIDMDIYPGGNPVNMAAFYFMIKFLKLERVFNDTVSFILLSFQSELG
jgi:hypothetical protein